MTSRPVVLACAYAFVGWAFFTALLVALGNVLVPPISRPLTPLVVAGLAGLTGVAVAGISLDYFRRAGRSDVVAALTLGVCLAAIGLALDAVLLLATEFDYPGVDDERTPTVAVLLLLGYAIAAVAPLAAQVSRGRARPPAASRAGR